MTLIRRSLGVPTLVSGLVLGAIAASAACATRSDESLGIAAPDRDASLSFVAEAGTNDCTADGTCDAGLVQYCPVTECPDPYATCASSRFACDVNLLNDPLNCGGCGFSCYNNSGSATYACIEGKCTFACAEGWADCNNLPDDDCETKLGTNGACAACGDVCPDPAKPCIARQGAPSQCGCDPGQTYCDQQRACVDTQSDDQDCGSCGTTCTPTLSDGGTLPPNVYLGCQNGVCGHPKCESGWADCDGKSNNGCETNLLLPTSCGACTTVCAPGQSCRSVNGRPTCVCPPGRELCGDTCVDLATSTSNCGTCGNNCAFAKPFAGGRPHCAYGSCRYECLLGRGDCNGDPSDGCETNLNADPRNCGVCGNACDMAGGQPCIAGRCAVEPCQGGGVTTQ